MPDLARHSITYRIAVIPLRCHKAFMIQTLATCDEKDREVNGRGSLVVFFYACIATSVA